MAYQNKSLYNKLLETEIVLDIVSAENEIKELESYIEIENYGKALYKMILHLLRALNESNLIEDTTKVIYIDKLIDLLDSFYKESKDIEKLTKDFSNILIRYIRYLKFEAFIRGNRKLEELLGDTLNGLEFLL